MMNSLKTIPQKVMAPFRDPARRAELREALRHPSIPLLLYLVNLFLISPAFFLNLSEINPFDESAYINSGRMLLSGSLPNFAGNPLVDVLYALTYLPFRSSPYWLMLSASLGRFILFSLLWLSVYLIATRLSRWANPVIMLGIFLVTPLAVETLRFPSDPLFAALAGLAFWQLLGFHEDLEVRHLWLGSAFLGLAAMARNDGLVLFVIFFGLATFLSLRRVQLRSILAPSLVPFLILVGGYVLLAGAVTGSFELGTTRRTYENFESGQQVIFGGSGESSPVVEARLEARRIFGTPAENNYSVFNAIRRNPGVYLTRVSVLAQDLPDRLLRAYGIRFAALLALLAVRGLIELWRRKQFRLLVVFLLWPLYALTGFVITIFRPGHLQFHYYLVFGLAALGLAGLLRNLDDRRERYIWYAVLLGLVLYGLVDNKLAIYYGAAVFLVALWLVYLTLRRYRTLQGLEAILLLILLCAGLIIRGNFPSPKLPALGSEAREQAAVFMAENLTPDTKVAAGSPGVVWLARMDYAAINAADTPRDKNDVEFLDWMIRQDIEAIFVDQSLYNSNPLVWGLIKSQIGEGIERVFSADEGDVQVLIIRQ